MKTLITILLIVVIQSTTLSQENLYYLDKKEYAIGLSGLIGLNSHNPDFNSLGDIPCCSPNFSTGTGFGINVGFIYQYPISQKFELNAKINYRGLGGDLTSEERLPIESEEVINANENDIAVIDHIIISNISTLGVSFELNYYLLEKFYLKSGFEIGYLINTEYEQEERLVQPTNRGVFKDTQTRIRNQFNGEIPNSSTFITFLNLGVGYNLPLNERQSFVLAPEINFSLALNNINNQPWTVNTIQVGFNLLFNSLDYNLSTPIEPAN